VSTQPVLTVLVGPTAAGKTELALRAAESVDFPVEIVGVDSRQLYRQLSIGTAKPTPMERARVRHHLVDCIDITERTDAGSYRRDVELTLADVLARGATPLFVGGAGFYLRALTEGFLDLPDEPQKLELVREALEQQSIEELREQLQEMDPKAAARLHPNDRYRIMRALEIVAITGVRLSDHEERFEPRPLLGADFSHFHLSPEREDLHQRIRARAVEWLAGAWQGEVQALLEAGWSADCPGLSVLGYPEVRAELRGDQSREATVENVVVATRRYARQQETWFRKLPVQGRAPDGDAMLAEIVEALRKSHASLGSS